MTMQIKELPENESDTPGARIKAARENKGITRKKIADMTGVPVKSLEKIEYGLMEVNISRLKAICLALDIEPSFILEAGENDTSVKNMENIPNHTYVANEYLHMLDVLREVGFENSIRKTEAYFKELKSTLCFLEYDELLELAQMRGINIEDAVSNNPDTEEVEKHSETNDAEPAPENTDCEELASRIIDTAIFGVDFYSISLSALSITAEKYEIEADRFFFLSWRGHSEIVPKIRERFLDDALIGKAEENFLDENKYGKSEAA